MKATELSTSDFTTTLLFDQTPKEVFDSINNPRAWWSEEIEGITNKLNAAWDYHYEDVHRCKIKVTELVPNRKVVWLVLDNYFSFTEDKSEWKGTRIIFELTETENKTHLLFTHAGLVPEYECYDICQNAWTTYIHKSLHGLITTGKGQPNGKDKPQTKDEEKLTENFTTTVFVDQSTEEVFNAITNVRGWWQGEVTGNTTKLNDEFTYQMEDVHFSKQKVVEVIPNAKIVWRITDSKLNFINKKNEWTGTEIIFDIREINNKTQLRFTHVGLVPAIECYGGCSGAWTDLIQKSLFSLITTGTGKKVF